MINVMATCGKEVNKSESRRVYNFFLALEN